jgi:GPH family glycoside/pentoside/hexuronide:cation symporter
MTQEHHLTAPEDRIPILHKLAYGAGAFVNNLLAAAIGGMTIVLNLGLGMNPADVGKLAALPRLLDAITDPLMGYISDNTRSRWGRRRPYIFCGAIAVGVVFALLWQLPEGRSQNFYYWFFLIGSLIFYVAYTVFATPWVALGYELTPDYHERTRLMGVQNAMGQVAYAVAPWFLAIMYSETLFDGVVEGAAWLAVGIGVLAITIGVFPAIVLRERYQEVAEAEVAVHGGEKRSLGSVIGDFARGFLITLSFKPFLMLCVATFLVFNGFILVSAFQSYVIIFYVFAGDEAHAAQYIGLSGTVGAVSTFAVIALVTWLSTHWGKRQTFFAAIGVSVVGYASKWFCYHPDYPLLVLLPAPLMAFGLGALFTLMPSMIADVCDLDELKTGERREGMYGSIFWWVVKLGMSVALLGGGYLLNYTGFDVDLGGAQTAETIRQMRMFDAGIPALASIVAIWMVWAYPITEERAYEVRETLEARRGAVGEAVPA